MTGVFLQARMRSTRLPGKALLRLAGLPVVEHAMRSLRRLPAAVHALLTDESSAASLGPVAERCGFRVFVGSESNVLERYVFAARRLGVEQVIRATGDNPLVSWELARMAVARYRALGCDFFAWDGPPLGTGVEVVRAAALDEGLRSGYTAYEAEHASPRLYRHPDRYTIVRMLAPPAYNHPQTVVSIDTKEDYERLVELYGELYDGDPIPVLRLLRWLRARAGGGNEHAARA